MTGRQWRYALSMMPHIVAGVCGPAKAVPVRYPDAEPAVAVAEDGRSSGDLDELDGGHDLGGSGLESAGEVLPAPQVPDVVSSVNYRLLYVTLPLHRVVLDV